MVDLEVNEIIGEGYQNRTLLNVKSAELTISFANNYNSGGEKLTRRLAGNKFLALPLNSSVRDNSIKLYRYCRDNNIKSINIAGNGLATLNRGSESWSQCRVNQYVYDVLYNLCNHHSIELMVSGGQTGVDIAGAIASKALGIKFILNMPEGLRQRNIYGVDHYNTREDVISQVFYGVSKLDIKKPHI